MDGLNHTINIKRYQTTLDAEGVPVGNATDVTTSVLGYVHEYPPGQEQDSYGGAIGARYHANALLPYGTTVAEQDLLTVTFPDGRTKTFRVAAVRDNYIMLRCDLVRVVA